MTTSVPSICPIIASPWPRPITTIVGVARLAARKAVKQQMKDAGLKPAWIEHAVIVAAANEYLDKHWDKLLEEAAETIDRWPPFRKMAEQEAKARKRKLYQITPPKSAHPKSTIPSTWLQAPGCIDKGLINETGSALSSGLNARSDHGQSRA